MLRREEIAALALIQNGDKSQFRESSYDLRVGTIYAPGGTLVSEEFLVPPHGLVEVVSTERIVVPPDICGRTAVRTALCNEGVLAINIGIVDPGWEGHVSSTLINFSHRPYKLCKGQVFLRITFECITPPPGKFSPPPIPTDKEYHLQAQLKASLLSPTFLDIEGTAKRVHEDIFGRWKVGLGVIVAIGGLIALGATLANLYLSFLGQQRSAYSAAKEAVTRTSDRMSETERRIEAIETALRRDAVQSAHAVQSFPATATPPPSAGQIAPIPKASVVAPARP